MAIRKLHLASERGYSEVMGEMLLLQFAFIYTTAYVRTELPESHGKC
jgi:hypothetical protein